MQLAIAALGLVIGAGLMPLLIFLAGTATLGRYEGASLGNIYRSLYSGLRSGSTSAWIVLIGPYGFYLLFKGLKLWWRTSAKFADFPSRVKQHDG